jgi:uncharacterized damage-inducible protein DinB
VPEIRDGLAELAGAWEAILTSPGDVALSREVSYVNSKGEPWTSAVKDVLTHVVTHSAYHRGQIAAEMRRAGHEPAYTDFIEAVRRGLVR